jgi:hypothetical protein
VFDVHEALADVQRIVAIWISALYKVPDCVFGYTANKSIMKNAQVHVKNAQVHVSLGGATGSGPQQLLTADISDFFDSITVQQVSSSLGTLGYNHETCDMLSYICTRDGRLPQGSRASPVISNLVCHQLDLDLVNLARHTSSVYTRYADDLAFSGNEVPTRKAISDALDKNGFRLRDGSVRLMRRGRAQIVTGLSVADSKSPRLRKEQRKHLRQKAYLATKFPGQLSSAELAHLKGELAFAISVDVRFKRLLAMLSRTYASDEGYMDGEVG